VRVQLGIFIRSYYVLIMGFFARSVVWRFWCVCCKCCLSIVGMFSGVRVRKSFPLPFSPIIYKRSSSPPFMLYAQPISSSLFRSCADFMTRDIMTRASLRLRVRQILISWNLFPREYWRNSNCV
jgi:hypothetical protein